MTTPSGVHQRVPHPSELVVGEVYARHGLSSLEFTDEVLESAASVVFDQAANRLRTINALLVATLAGA